MDSKQFRTQLGKGLQIERNEDGSWLTHVDQESLLTDFNIEVDSFVLSKAGGIETFNRVSESFGVPALRDPSGYMALEDNVQSYLKSSYQHRYEETLDNIDANIVDGTGYGVEAVLDKIDSVIRKDMKNNLPQDMVYGDLRFVKATVDHKETIDKLSSARVSKTLAYEKRRSYEDSSLERIDKRFEDVGQELKVLLDNPSSSQGLIH